MVAFAVLWIVLLASSPTQGRQVGLIFNHRSLLQRSNCIRSRDCDWSSIFSEFTADSEELESNTEGTGEGETTTASVEEGEREEAETADNTSGALGAMSAWMERTGRRTGMFSSATNNGADDSAASVESIPVEEIMGTESGVIEDSQGEANGTVEEAEAIALEDEPVVVDETNTTAANETAVLDVSQEALSRHNTYRSKHDVPDLAWSDGLASSAQEWADGCRIPMVHSGAGENLAYGFGSIGAAIDAWYNEVDKYDYDNPGFSGETGHFTQIVWKSTQRLGCAAGNCPDVNGGYYVCQYGKCTERMAPPSSLLVPFIAGELTLLVPPEDPPGNYIGQFEENVLPPVQ